MIQKFLHKHTSCNQEACNKIKISCTDFQLHTQHYTCIFVIIVAQYQIVSAWCHMYRFPLPW